MSNMKNHSPRAGQEKPYLHTLRAGSALAHGIILGKLAHKTINKIEFYSGGHSPQLGWFGYQLSYSLNSEYVVTGKIRMQAQRIDGFIWRSSEYLAHNMFVHSKRMLAGSGTQWARTPFGRNILYPKIKGQTEWQKLYDFTAMVQKEINEEVRQLLRL